jgi:hypothetical protein
MAGRLVFSSAPDMRAANDCPPKHTTISNPMMNPPDHPLLIIDCIFFILLLLLLHKFDQINCLMRRLFSSLYPFGQELPWAEFSANVFNFFQNTSK